MVRKYWGGGWGGVGGELLAVDELKMLVLLRNHY